MLVGVIVGFANERPPSDQDYAFVVVEAENETEAMLVACQIVQATSVMATSSSIHTIFEI